MIFTEKMRYDVLGKFDCVQGHIDEETFYILCFANTLASIQMFSSEQNRSDIFVKNWKYYFIFS